MSNNINKVIFLSKIRVLRLALPSQQVLFENIECTFNDAINEVEEAHLQFWEDIISGKELLARKNGKFYKIHSHEVTKESVSDEEVIIEIA